MEAGPRNEGLSSIGGGRGRSRVASSSGIGLLGVGLVGGFEVPNITSGDKDDSAPSGQTKTGSKPECFEFRYGKSQRKQG